uniref:MROH2B-like N-terminal HEAT-repeats domain-containing protein n=1 Tax=Geospiza parvula TaxID=87175 RepID=A0A8U8BBI5_GEOPR
MGQKKGKSWAGFRGDCRDSGMFQGWRWRCWEASAEAEPEVQQQLREALSGLGAADPEELLQCCGDYLRSHDKLPAPQRALILASMGAVVRSHLGELGKAAANDAVALGAQEISRAKEAQWEWQEAAGALLVELGRRFLARVMEELLRQFPPGALPQPGLVRTFADLAAANGEPGKIRAESLSNLGIRPGKCGDSSQKIWELI